MRVQNLSRSTMRQQRQHSTRRRMFLEQLERREVLTGLPPTVVNDSFLLAPDQVLNVDAPGILANDTDAEGDAMTAVVFSGPQHGTLSLNGDGSFSYTPEAGFTGIDSFTYRADDGTSLSGLAAVTLRIEANATPVAENDEFNATEGSVLTIGAPGVLTNDTDADGDALSAVLVDGPANGLLTLNEDGSFEYTPNADFTGVDSFTYTASDGVGSSEAATVTINVNPINAVPEAGNDTFTLDEDATLNVDAAGGLMANDSDADGDSLTAMLVSGPAHGSLTLNADGSFSYTPEENYNGIDGFSYLVNDGQSDSDVASVTLNINAVNDLPVAGNDEFTTDEDVALTIDAPGMLANDSDIDGDALSAILVSGPANGAVTVNADGSFTYTPNADFNGIDGFSYKVSDGSGESDVATVTIDVTAVNDLPVGAEDSFTVDEDAVLTVDAAGGVLANDSDADGDSLTAALVAGPANGSVTLNADGSFEYIPAANFSGSDSFTYTANDASGASAETTVTITVNPVNDAPTSAEDAYATDEDTVLSVDAAGGVLANDSDAEGDAMSAILVSGPANGSLTLNADGSFEYTPNADFNGSDSFVYKASDGTVEGPESTVTITVNPVNDAPTATDDLFATDEDGTLTVDAAGGVLANDADPEGDAMSAILVNGPASGSVTLNADGSFSYTPNAEFNGTDSFTYMVSDGTAESGEATVTINVNSVNDAPVSVNDEFNTNEDEAITIPAPGILENDSDVDGDALSAELVSGPANGTVTVNPDGSFTYTPNPDFIGVDGFSYQVSDGDELSDVATVTINVCPVNDAPIAIEDAFSTDEDTPLVLDAAGGVLANDSDVDGDELEAILVSGPANGSLTLNADGSLEYIPNADFSGTDTFTYKVSDGTEESAEITATITVNPINDAPAAADDAFATDEDAELVVDAAGGVLANDTDAEGDALSATIVDGPANGSVTLNADGSFTYMPNADFSGSDTFTYKASDGTAESELATVNITVNSVNDAPVAADDAFTVDEDTALTVEAPGVLGNDSDPEGDVLSATILDGPANGTVSMDSDGGFTYTPNANFSGTDTFTYQASDGSGGSAEATVTITVIDTNDGPTARADAYSMAEDGTLEVTSGSGVLRNDVDPDADPMSAIMVDGPSHGTLALNADGSFSYTPDADFTGQDSFSYQASDGTESSETVTVTINVNPVNDAPVASDDSYVGLEDSEVTIDAAEGVLANDTDIEGDTLTPTLIQGPQHGSVTLNADGSFTYTPESGFVGDDTFTYQVNDGQADSDVATVTISIGQTTDEPHADDDQFSVISGNTLNVDAPGILANDTDPDGDPLTATLVEGPANGTLTLNADGSLSYTPSAGFTGTDSFTYTATDGSGVSNEATVSIDVQAATPIVRNVAGVNDRYSLEQDTTLSIDAPGVLANDTDADGDSLSAVLFSDVQHGTLTLNSDGSFEYTPEAGFAGTDSFVYRATDGANFSLLTAVTLRVTLATSPTPAPSPSPIPEPIPDPCTCESDDDSSDDLIAPASDPLDSLAIVEGDSTDLDDIVDEVVSEEDEEDVTDSVDDFFTTVGSCA